MQSDILLDSINSTSSAQASAFVSYQNASDLFKNDVSLQLARVICTQILMPIVCVIGIAGNILNIIVLTTATMRSSTSCYLCALAVYDLLYSLTGIPLTLRTYSSLEKSVSYMSALTYLLPLGNMWSNITAWLTCAFTIERFLAISTPIRSRKNFSIRRTQWNIVFVSLLIAIITLPDFFERKIREARRTCFDAEHSVDSVDVCVEKFYVFESTWISTQLDRYGWSYANVALFVFIPLIILAIFNAILIKSVIKAHHERNKMLVESIRTKFEERQNQSFSPNPPSARKDLAWRKWWITRQYSLRGSTLSMKPPVETCSEDNTYNTNTSEGTVATSSGKFATSVFQIKPQDTQHCFNCKKRDAPYKHNVPVIYRSSHQDKQSITITLIAVVVVFCILNAPSAVIHLIRPWFKPSDPRLRAFGNVSNLLLMLNASLNFFLYSMFSARFRRSFQMLLKKRRS